MPMQSLHAAGRASAQQRSQLLAALVDAHRRGVVHNALTKHAIHVDTSNDTARIAHWTHATPGATLREKDRDMMALRRVLDSTPRGPRPRPAPRQPGITRGGVVPARHEMLRAYFATTFGGDADGSIAYVTTQRERLEQTMDVYLDPTDTLGEPSQPPAPYPTQAYADAYIVGLVKCMLYLHGITQMDVLYPTATDTRQPPTPSPRPQVALFSYLVRVLQWDVIGARFLDALTLHLKLGLVRYATQYEDDCPVSVFVRAVAAAAGAADLRRAVGDTGKTLDGFLAEHNDGTMAAPADTGLDLDLGLEETRRDFSGLRATGIAAIRQSMAEEEPSSLVQFARHLLRDIAQDLGWHRASRGTYTAMLDHYRVRDPTGTAILLMPASPTTNPAVEYWDTVVRRRLPVIVAGVHTFKQALLGELPFVLETNMTLEDVWAYLSASRQSDLGRLRMRDLSADARRRVLDALRAWNDSVRDDMCAQVAAQSYTRLASLPTAVRATLPRRPGELSLPHNDPDEIVPPPALDTYVWSLPPFVRSQVVAIADADVNANDRVVDITDDTLRRAIVAALRTLQRRQEPTCVNGILWITRLDSFRDDVLRRILRRLARYNDDNAAAAAAADTIVVVNGAHRLGGLPDAVLDDLRAHMDGQPLCNLLSLSARHNPHPSQHHAPNILTANEADPETYYVDGLPRQYRPGPSTSAARTIRDVSAPLVRHILVESLHRHRAFPVTWQTVLALPLRDMRRTYRLRVLTEVTSWNRTVLAEGRPRAFLQVRMTHTIREFPDALQERLRDRLFEKIVSTEGVREPAPRAVPRQGTWFQTLYIAALTPDHVRQLTNTEQYALDSLVGDLPEEEEEEPPQPAETLRQSDAYAELWASVLFPADDTPDDDDDDDDDSIGTPNFGGRDTGTRDPIPVLSDAARRLIADMEARAPTGTNVLAAYQQAWQNAGQDPDLDAHVRTAVDPPDPRYGANPQQYMRDTYTDVISQTVPAFPCRIEYTYTSARDGHAQTRTGHTLVGCPDVRQMLAHNSVVDPLTRRPIERVGFAYDAYVAILDILNKYGTDIPTLSDDDLRHGIRPPPM